MGDAEVLTWHSDTNCTKSCATASSLETERPSAILLTTTSPATASQRKSPPQLSSFRTMESGRFRAPHKMDQVRPIAAMLPSLPK